MQSSKGCLSDADTISRVLEYAGFAMKYFPVLDPSLVYLYTNVGILVQYFAFLHARGLAPSTLATHSTAMDKVLVWLAGVSHLSTLLSIR